MSGWRDTLVQTANGSPKACVANLELCLMHDRRLVLAYNEWTERAVWLEPPPWRNCPVGSPVEDADSVGLLAHCERQHGVSCSLPAVGRVIDHHARKRRFDPMVDYLRALKWDGEQRVLTWLSRYLGAEDSAVTRAVGCSWLIQAAARALEPGCQADSVLVLEGLQGSRKSSALRVLAGADWFSDSLPSITSKDAAIALQGIWVLEIGEMEAVRGVSENALKAWITRRVESYRPPYAARNIAWGRRCVFVGTTNDTEYLHDSTGNRRWWPVRCTQIDLEALKRDRDQLWAEAVTLYMDGCRYWIDRSDKEVYDALVAAQDARRVQTRWEVLIGQYLDAQTHDEISLEDLCRHLDLSVERSGDHATATRIGRIVSSLGWRSEQVLRGGVRRRVYRRIHS